MAALLLALLVCVPAGSASAPDPTIVSAARAALVSEAGERAKDAELVSVTRAEWPDAALGCARPGESHPPARTAGHRVIFRLDGAIYRVHVAGDTAVVCGAPLSSSSLAPEAAPSPSPAPEPDDPAARRIVARARADLAGRLRVPASEIELIEYANMTWPDGSLGCPKPGLAYTQVLQEGALIRLRARGRVYAYHAGSRGEPFLCEKKK